MSKRPRASKNLAKDVEIREKRIPIPEPARTQILQRHAGFNTYVSGVAAGLGAGGNWTLDLQTMEFVMKVKDEK